MKGYASSTGWIATYEELPDGRIKAHITDSNGRTYAYDKIFDSFLDMKNFLDNQ